MIWIFECSYEEDISLVSPCLRRSLVGLTSENTSKSLGAPSGLNLTTLAASLPDVEAPERVSPVTGSTSIGNPPLAAVPPPLAMEDIRSEEKEGEEGEAG
jgi:hypothetical protein